jgi:hypothetical protein
MKREGEGKAAGQPEHQDFNLGKGKELLCTSKWQDNEC